MALRAVDPIGSDNESFSFELDRFELDGDQGLELRGRWFGVRGRRFVRPTLTMRLDGAKHRLLADLEHKPWAAEEGEEWIASFSSAPAAGDAKEIELAVAPDIAISLSAPGSRSPSATVKRSANTARVPARTPSRRKGPSDRVGQALEQERIKARDLSRELEEAKTDYARLAADRDALIAEREALITERRIMRREQLLSRERVVELQRQVRASEASVQMGLSEAQERLEAERAETNRLRGALDSREAAVADRDRLTRELGTVVAERDRLAAQAAVTERNRPAAQAAVTERDRPAAAASQARRARPETPPVSRGVPVRRTNRADSSRRPDPAWAVRAMVITALCSVMLTLVVVLHLV